jgi:mono/diheme cytochrome c family protein
MLFRLHCSECHGDGSGNGHRVTALKGKPKDMTKHAWQQQVTDEHLFLTISEGGPAAKLHGDMPAWNRVLSKRQIKDLITYIRTLDD